MATTNADFSVNDQGTIVVFTPLTNAADAFLSRCETADWQWLGPSLCVDHRPAIALIEAILEEGLKL